MILKVLDTYREEACRRTHRCQAVEQNAQLPEETFKDCLNLRRQDGTHTNRHTDRQTWYDKYEFLDFEDMISSQGTEKTEQEGGSYDELPEETSMEQGEEGIHDELSADHESSDVMDMDSE